MAEDEEKTIGGSVPSAVPNTDPQHAHYENSAVALGDGKLLLTEEEAWERARRQPNTTLPIFLIFSPDDRDNPRNWPAWKRWYICCFANLLNVLTCWCAGGISAAAEGIQSDFGVSAEVTTLCLSMYVLGFAVGPMLLAPLSENFGRRNVYIGSWFSLVVLQLPIALAPNIGTIIVCRFLAGFAGSAPLTNTGGSISDLFRRDESGAIMAVYGLSSTLGPPSALPVTSYIAQNLGWRWVFWVLMAITGGFWILLVLTVPETRHTFVLKEKCRRVRKEMEKEGLSAAKSIKDANADEHDSLASIIRRTLTRPLHFLFTEPITMFAATYNGFLFGLVFLFNEAFPLVFGPGGHGFDGGQVGLSFLGLTLGPVIAFCFYPLQERYYQSRLAANNGKGVPEARVWMARGGAFLIPISLFWFAWTSYPTIHWIVPIIASAFFGAGIYIIILSILNYVVDSYQTYSASALAGVILVRNMAGGAFPLFAEQMYKGLGNEWASSLLGFLAILLIPIPFILFYKGEAIRLRSPWAREHFEQDEDAPH
ncbi:major facilitator superfamily domain-containing protein [Xylariaceae sp. FL1272]|nr:major facilitator superfamily domain-containing protein [Xylariaceae sp. FL1272]